MTPLPVDERDNVDREAQGTHRAAVDLAGWGLREATVERPPDERFCIFVSHKHEDHGLALTVRDALHALGGGKIECFVSGVDISAGADWNREIKARLARSHLLVLLFTSPSENWDWCLYEAGLFARFDADEVSAIACLHNADSGAPRPLANLQSVAAEQEPVERFIGLMCHKTWCISDDWRRGPLAPEVTDDQIASAAAAIVSRFPRLTFAERSHYACHRVVLDLRDCDRPGSIIPESARVVEGPAATSGFTLSLFNRADGRRTLTWRDLLEAVDGTDAEWRHQLDRRFAAALDEQLFTPISATMRAWNHGRPEQGIFKPVLYRIVRAPAVDGDDPRGRPIEVTIIFDPLLDAGSSGAYAGTVQSRAERGIDVFSDIREAVRAVYEDADRFGMFEERALRRVYGEMFERDGIAAMGAEWEDGLARLDAALGDRDAAGTEAELARLAELNRRFSMCSTERYLELLRIPAGS
jgi:hypothetical protein